MVTSFCLPCGDPKESVHLQDISAEHVWPLLGEVKAKYLLLEGANPRHRRDVQCFEMAVRKGYFKSHQVCRTVPKKHPKLGKSPTFEDFLEQD